MNNDEWFIELELIDEYSEEQQEFTAFSYYPIWDEGAQAYDEIRGQ